MMEDNYLETLTRDISEASHKCRICMSCYADCPLQLSTRGFVTNGPTGITKALYYGILWDIQKGKETEDLREIVYSCTTCGACVLRCQKSACGLELVDVIEKGRRYLVEKMIGPLPQQRQALDAIYKYGNPYGESPEKRLNWLQDAPVKKLPAEQAEILLYVGCTASFEPELHPVARSVLKLMQGLNVDFGILENEVCCGDPARTLGDEFLFEEMKQQNVDKLVATGVKTIVTISPHCFNAYAKQYGEWSERFKVMHYTEFLAKAFNDKPPVFQGSLSETVTYHDPCYLGKRSNVYDAPRDLLKRIPGVKLVEMAMSRANSLCCGGGGGRMYAEVEETQRLSETRVRQAQDVGARIIATACPWCHMMLLNAVRDLNLQEHLRVADISELLAEAMAL
ncbi:MAG: (Fe-S)-binding protein [Deltaproteobacteria bacterium]|nr:(Fe-S)-binding protein [Deltaproteobacteria bacterium]